MANEKSDSGDWLNEEALDSDDLTGDDWESAFQAEDISFSLGEEEEKDFFLKEQSSPNPYQFTPPAASELTTVPDLDQDAAPKPHSALPKSSAAATQHQTESGVSRRRLLLAWVRALPLLHKFALGVVAVLALFLALILGNRNSIISQPIPEPTQSPPYPVFQAPIVATQPEQIRHRWEFEPFMVPVTAADPEIKIVFLEVDLTLLLILAPAGEPPHAQKIYVRELIYRFFLGQPPDALRRFALARGEMNRLLLTWLREQWPEAPVETIIFNRYQLG